MSIKADEKGDGGIGEILELQKKVRVLEQQLTEKEKLLKDPSKRGYYALCKILYQQIEFLEDFALKDKIKESAKDDKLYERATKIWEGLKAMILDCRDLKSELNISPAEEEKEMKRLNRLTPETMSNVLGNTAGKIN